MYLPFNATNNDYVNTHITNLKTCLNLTRLLGLLYCGLTKLKTSSKQKNLKQTGQALGTTRAKCSSGKEKVSTFTKWITSLTTSIVDLVEYQQRP